MFPLAGSEIVPLTQAETEVGSPAWLQRFHAGEHALIEACYRAHARAVRDVAASVVSPVDAETIVHEVFVSLLSEPRTRESFRGGSLPAWLCRVTRNRAIDLLRRRKREHLAAPETIEALTTAPPHNQAELQSEARQLVAGFRETALPVKLAPVFETRLVRQLSQREAARRLGISRTTLALRERRVRRLLKRYVLGAPRRLT